MILFETNTPKRIEFFIAEMSNVDKDKTKVAARLKVGDVEYVFPGNIVNDTIIINIPPLGEAIAPDLSDITEYSMVIEAIAEDSYLVPYSDAFMVRNKAKLEVKINEVVDVENPVNKKKIKVEIKTTDTKNEIIHEKIAVKKTKSLKEKFLKA